MANVKAIIAKVDSTMNKFLPQGRTIYKRVVTTGSGDSLIGRATTTNVDTVFSPQPIYGRITRYPVGPQAHGEMVGGSASVESASSYACTFSSSAITIADLTDKNVFIVMKDPSSNNEEVFRITDYETTGLMGTTVMYTAYIESIARS